MTARGIVCKPMKARAIFFKHAMRHCEGVELQNALHYARLADEIPDTVLFLQHTPVITLGRHASREHILASANSLRELGVDIEQTTRGGDVTYHGPGQWIMYPIIKLDTNSTGVRGYMHDLEEIACRTAQSFGVQSFRRKGLNGAWTAAGKLAAIGLHIRRWVTLHGLSFNVSVDIKRFNWIVPCGLQGEPVTSLADLLGCACPAMEDVGTRLAKLFGQIRQREMEIIFCEKSALDARIRFTT